MLKQALNGFIENKTPVKNFESRFLNRIGLQPARIVSNRLFFKLRPSRCTQRVSDYNKTLQKRGWVSIPNFLSKDVLEKVQAEYEHAFEQNSKRRSVLRAGPNILESALVGRGMGFPELEEHFLDNSFIQELILAATRRPWKSPLVATMLRYYCDPVPRPDAEVYVSSEYDSDHTWHRDHSFPVYKMWFAVEDIDADNGAFEFMDGSHRFHPARLRDEYEYDNGLWKDNQHWIVENDRPAFSKITQRKMGFKPVKMVVPANTLTIACTNGFHRRGVIQPGQSRKQIFFDFRYLERFGNQHSVLFPLLINFQNLYRRIRYGRK